MGDYEIPLGKATVRLSGVVHELVGDRAYDMVPDTMKEYTACGELVPRLPSNRAYRSTWRLIEARGPREAVTCEACQTEVEACRRE